MKIKTYNLKGKKLGSETLSDLGEKKYETLVFEKLRKIALAKIRTSAAKTRNERRGGGRKPWRQKGTGRARVGSIRSPLWRKGGVIHGPKKEKNFQRKINKKALSLTKKWLLSQKAKEGNLLLFDIEEKDVPKKTKDFEAILIQLPLKEGSVIFLHHFKKNPSSAKNISYLECKQINKFNLKDLMNNQNIIITKKAFSKIKKDTK